MHVCMYVCKENPKKKMPERIPLVGSLSVFYLLQSNDNTAHEQLVCVSPRTCALLLSKYICVYTHTHTPAHELVCVTAVEVVDHQL